MACTGTKLCNIKNRRGSFAIVKENNYATLIVDRNQGWKRHLLVIPDSHSENISQVDQITWKQGLGPLIAWTIRQLRNDPDIVGFHINTNAGLEAHQTEFHTHIHIVPTYRNAYRKVNNVDIKGFKSNFTSTEEKGYKIFAGGKWDAEENILKEWNNVFAPFKNHLEICKSNGILNVGGKNELTPFHVFARIGEVDGGNYENVTFHFLPNPRGKNEFRWLENFAFDNKDITELKGIRDKILALSSNPPPPPPPDPDIVLHAATIKAVNDYWIANQEVLVGKDKNTVLGGANWENLINTKLGTVAINTEKNRLINLINAAKSTGPRNPNPPAPPPNLSKDQLQRQIDNCDKWIDWETNYQKISSFNPLEQRELKNNLLNNLLKIISLYTDLEKLSRLEGSYKKHQIYTENTDEIRSQIDQFYSNHRREIEKNNSSQPPQNTPFLAKFWPVILIIPFLVAFLIVFIRQRKRHKLKK